MTSINQVPVAPSPVICDFGWTYGLAHSRLPEVTYTIGNSTYPPGMTLLGAGTVDEHTTQIPSAFTSLVDLQASFPPAGTITLDNLGGIVTQFTYSDLTTAGGHQVFDGCVALTPGGYTFSTTGLGTAVYDPRYYVDEAPTFQSIQFDALDSNGLGLPKVIIPPNTINIHILEYLWDLGNGQTASGPQATVTYDYTLPPLSLQVSLTVIDSLGRSSSAAHPLIMTALSSLSYGMINQ